MTQKPAEAGFFTLPRTRRPAPVRGSEPLRMASMEMLGQLLLLHMSDGRVGEYRRLLVTRWRSTSSAFAGACRQFRAARERGHGSLWLCFGAVRLMSTLAWVVASRNRNT